MQLHFYSNRRNFMCINPILKRNAEILVMEIKTQNDRENDPLIVLRAAWQNFSQYITLNVLLLLRPNCF